MSLIPPYFWPLFFDEKEKAPGYARGLGGIMTVVGS